MSAGKIGTESGAKLRLLCLHGYRQDALTFRSKIGSLRKAMKNRADFIFIDGPYPIKETENGETEVVGRAWWNWSEAAEGQSNGSGSTSAGKTTAAHYLGWSESFDAIGSALEEHWPIDGILGFSQGATAAAIYLAQTLAIHHPDINKETRCPRFAILISGYVPRDKTFADLLQKSSPINRPTLHVIGQKDDVILPHQSHALCKHFSMHDVFMHGGGHMVPTCSGVWKRTLVQYLDQYRDC